MSSKIIRQNKLLSFLEKAGKDGISATNLYKKMLEAEVSISVATIYRLLDTMVDEGVCVKNPGAGGPNSSTYVYMPQNAEKKEDRAKPDVYYLKCENCGRFITLHCILLSQLKDHIKDHHDFHLTPHKTVLFGLCGDCKRKLNS